MDADFWQSTWQKGSIGFHQSVVHTALQEHAAWFTGDAPHRVLVPLCGKTLDIPWLRDQGHRVVGVELVPDAVAAFHAEQHISATQAPQGAFTAWSSPGVNILQGSIFDLTAADVVGVRRVWDRAALVALTPAQRAAYAQTLRQLLPPGTLVLLSAFEYDPAVMSGPPHSIPIAEVLHHYDGCKTELLASHDDCADGAPMAEALRARGHTFWLSHLWRITL